VYLALLFQKIFNLKYLLLLVLTHWTRRETVKGIVIITTLTLIIQWIQLIFPYPIIKGISRQVICSLVDKKKQLQLLDQRNSAAIINLLKNLKLIIFEGFPRITKVKSSNNYIRHNLSKGVTCKVFRQDKILYQISLCWRIILKRWVHQILNWTKITMEMRKVKIL